ncbi:MAG: hypothetical protein ACI8XO_004269, partial [Verrucomicrobiales bacterium]
MTRISQYSILLGLIFHAAITSAQPSFEQDLQPFLDSHCVRCHGEEKQKGKFRLD